MPTDRTLAESILRTHLLVALAELERLRVSLPQPLALVVTDGLRECQLTVSDGQADEGLTATCRAVVSPDAGPDTRPRLRERLLAAATSDPKTPRRLARLCGAKYNSHFRATLTQLCREDLLAKHPDGIVRAPDTGPAPGGGQSPADSSAG